MYSTLFKCMLDIWVIIGSGKTKLYCFIAYHNFFCFTYICIIYFIYDKDKLSNIIVCENLFYIKVLSNPIIL